MRVTVLRNALPGRQFRYWAENDELFIKLGAGLDELAQQRVISEAKRVYGLEPRRKRRILPIPLAVGEAAGRTRRAVAEHPARTAVAAGALAASVAAAVVVVELGDGPRRARPPAALPSASQSTRAPAVSRAPSSPPAPSRGQIPSWQTRFFPPPGAPLGTLPTGSSPPAPSPTTSPTGSSPPATPSPTPAPPADPLRCLVTLEVRPLLGLRLLCPN